MLYWVAEAMYPTYQIKKFFFFLNKDFISICPKRKFFISLKTGAVEVPTQPCVCGLGIRD